MFMKNDLIFTLLNKNIKMYGETRFIVGEKELYYYIYGEKATKQAYINSCRKSEEDNNVIRCGGKIVSCDQMVKYVNQVEKFFNNPFTKLMSKESKVKYINKISDKTFK